MADQVAILVVEDDPGQLATIATQLRRRFRVISARSLADAMTSLDETVQIVLSDIRLGERQSNHRDGLTLLAHVKQTFPRVPVVMMTAYGNAELIKEALRLGASDWLDKPIQIDQLPLRLEEVFRKEQLQQENRRLKEQLGRLVPGEIIGDSPQIQEVRTKIRQYAGSDSTVLILGESGVGKELVARALHDNSPRRREVYNAVNVSIYSKELLPTELFGSKRGAFTGAQDKIGLLEATDGGTIFMDEIGELQPDAQAQLLRFLEDKTFRRVGDPRERHVDVRLVVATNRDLQKAMKNGGFREDLYYRINVISIVVPPLRERSSDIPILARYFLGKFCTQYGVRIDDFEEDALAIVTGYIWPGNVRELHNIVERAVLVAKYDGSSRITAEHLPGVPTAGGAGPSEALAMDMVSFPTDLGQALARAELALINGALQAAKGQKGEAWKLLQLNDRHALLRRIQVLCRDHPDLARHFPYIHKGYKKLIAELNLES